MSGKSGGRSNHGRIILLILPLITLLISFHPWSSPASAAGEDLPRFDWPLKGKVTIPFRQPTGPYWEGGHAGMDIEAGRGTQVKASAEGVVVFAGFTPTGLCVSIDHQKGYRTTYVALLHIYVRKGERVSRGHVIALSDGSLDRSSSSPHLHFGVYLHGKPVDPLPFLSGFDPDPSECLFLGPCCEGSDVGGSSLSRRGELALSGAGGNELARGSALHRAWYFLAKRVKTAWVRFRDSVSRFFRERLWGFLTSTARSVCTGVRSLLSNPYAKGVLAGLLAALAVCAVIITGGLILGFSAAAIAVACVAGGIASVAYSLFMAVGKEGNISFWSCFTSALTLGLAVGGSFLFLHHLAPIFSSGFGSLGPVGFIKSFMAHGLSGGAIHWLTKLVRGEPLDLGVLLLVFLACGITGSIGRSLTQGLSLNHLAAATGVRMCGSGGPAFLSGYMLGGGISEKVSFVLLSGCFGFLSDLYVRLATGSFPEPIESALSFLGGCFAGTLAVTIGLRFAGRTAGRVGLINRLAGSDFLRGFTCRGLGNVTKELSREFGQAEKEGSRIVP